MPEDIDRKRMLQLAFAGWGFEEENDVLTSDEWHTPPELVDAIRDFFGGDIDLDPCSDPRAFVGARVSYTVRDDGLSRPWSGVVDGIPIRTRFVNPPYSKPGPWLRACASVHAGRGLSMESRNGETMALIKCDTSTRWWQLAWEADAILFFDKRIPFVRPGSTIRATAMFPSALVYWGAHPEGFAASFEWLGHVYQPHAAVTVESIVRELEDRGLVRVAVDETGIERVELVDVPVARAHERSGSHDPPRDTPLLAINGQPIDDEAARILAEADTVVEGIPIFPPKCETCGTTLQPFTNNRADRALFCPNADCDNQTGSDHS